MVRRHAHIVSRSALFLPLLLNLRTGAWTYVQYMAIKADASDTCRLSKVRLHAAICRVRFVFWSMNISATPQFLFILVVVKFEMQPLHHRRLHTPACARWITYI